MGTLNMRALEYFPLKMTNFFILFSSSPKTNDPNLFQKSNKTISPQALLFCAPNTRVVVVHTRLPLARTRNEPRRGREMGDGRHFRQASVRIEE